VHRAGSHEIQNPTLSTHNEVGDGLCNTEMSQTICLALLQKLGSEPSLHVYNAQPGRTYAQALKYVPTDLKCPLNESSVVSLVLFDFIFVIRLLVLKDDVTQRSPCKAHN